MKKHMLLFLKNGGSEEQKKAAETLRQARITVLAQYSEMALEVEATEEQQKLIRDSKLFDEIYDGPIDIGKMKHTSTEAKEIAAAWNLSHKTSFGVQKAPAANQGISWGTPGYDEPRPHSEISGDFFLTALPATETKGADAVLKRVPFSETKDQTSFLELEKRLLEKFKDRTQVYHLARLILIHPELEQRIMRMTEAELSTLFRTKKSDRANFGAAMAGPAAAPEESCWRMNGEISVGVVFVESSQNGGPVFTSSDRTTLRNEIQTGLNWLASQQPAGNLSWVYNYQYISINVANGNNSSVEDYWRNPAMQKVSYNGHSFTGNWTGVVNYRNDMRVTNDSAHAIVIFVTPYGTEWHAYASSARLTLANRNNWGGWGINTIDAITAHEVCHLFGAADEYTGSGTPCTSCSTTHGCDSVVNGNCKACASGGGVPCIMDQNSLSLCNFTRGQIGWSVYNRMGDSVELAGEVTEIAATRFNQHQVVTAVRAGNGSLKLIAWNVAANGAITRTGDSGSAAGAATSIAIARNTNDTRFVTACRAGDNSLKLISWNLNSGGTTITRLADSGTQAGEANMIRIVAVTANLFVAACRAGNNSLKLISWRLNANGSLTRLADSGSQAGGVQEIELIVLPNSRVLTPVRADNGTLKLISWNITNNAITRLADSAALAGDARIIRAAIDQTGHVITAVKAGNNSLKLISWTVAAGGQITRLNDSGSLAGETGDHDISLAGGRITTGVRTGSGNLKLILWQTTAGGAFTRLGDSGNLAGEASLINQCEELTGAPPIVTCVRTGSGTLKLISWKIN